MQWFETDQVMRFEYIKDVHYMLSCFVQGD